MKITIGQLRQMVAEAAKAAPPNITVPEAKAQIRAAVDDLFAATGRKGDAAQGSVRHVILMRGKPIRRISWSGIRYLLEPDGDDPYSLTPKALSKAFIDAVEDDASGQGPAYKLEAYAETLAWLRGRIAMMKDYMTSLRKMKGGADPDDPDAILGRFAFANDRVGKSKVPAEPDEAVERDLYLAFVDHFDSNEPLSKWSADKLRSLLKSGLYPDVIKEPEDETVFRGTNAGPNWIRRILRLKPGATVPPEGEADVSFTYSNPKVKNRAGDPGSSVMSWATKEAAAMEFFKSSASDVEELDKEMYTLLLTARVDDNPDTFVSGPGGLYNLRTVAKYKHESEALALGPVKVTHVRWKANRFARGPSAEEDETPPPKKKGKKKS